MSADGVAPPQAAGPDDGAQAGPGGGAQAGPGGGAQAGPGGGAQAGSHDGAQAGLTDPGAAPAGYVVEHRLPPAHRAVPRIGGARPLVALLIAVGMGVAALLIAVAGHRSGAAVPSATPAAAAPSAVAPAPAPATLALDGSGPASSAADLTATAVSLPTVGVRSSLVPLDVGPDGALQPPADPGLAGWYVHGSAPGEPGPTVIAGHVDSRSGPAVFYRLDQLNAGDRVEVTRSDGQVFAYRVVTVERHPKNDFPTEQVYGPTPGPELHLITCGGDFDRSIGHYRDNIVVTAIPTT